MQAAQESRPAHHEASEMRRVTKLGARRCRSSQEIVVRHDAGSRSPKRTAATADIELLGQGCGETLPSLRRIPTSYRLETNGERLYRLCLALVERNLADGELWQKTSKVAVVFARSAIQELLHSEPGHRKAPQRPVLRILPVRASQFKTGAGAPASLPSFPASPLHGVRQSGAGDHPNSGASPGNPRNASRIPGGVALARAQPSPPASFRCVFPALNPRASPARKTRGVVRDIGMGHLRPRTIRGARLPRPAARARRLCDEGDAVGDRDAGQAGAVIKRIAPDVGDSLGNRVTSAYAARILKEYGFVFVE